MTSNIKVVGNGIHVLEGDTHLSKWIEESGNLIHIGDVALQRNLTLINPGDVVVDGGAALGDHTAAYLKRVGEFGEVYAFEPNPDFYHCLVKNCPRALSYDRALWNESVWLSLDLDDVDGNIGAGHISQHGKLRVEAITLDSLGLGTCNFIKLDIEGAELNALRGAVETINRCKPIIQCEMNPPMLERMGTSQWGLERWLQQMGYTVEYFGVPSATGAHELIAMPK